MKFSVIIPVYNAEKYINESVQSVFNQTYKDFEIVLVNDGSTDHSVEICDKYSQEYPDKIQVLHQKNQGQLTARSRGIMCSRGEYCIFLDADDLLIEDMLSDLNDYIEEYSSPDIIVFPFYYDRNGQLEKSKLLNDQVILYKDKQLNSVYRSFFNGTLLNSVCTKAVSREIALKSTEGYEEYISLRCGEDRYQSMMMLQNMKSMLFVTNPYYRYRLVEGSTTREFAIDAIARFNMIKLYDIEKKYLKEWSLDSEEDKSQFEARWMAYPLYILDMFYHKVNNNNKKLVLAYPWDDFLPESIDYNKIQENKNLNDMKKRMWKWVEEKDYNRLRLYFGEKKLYKTIRKVKRMILE